MMERNEIATGLRELAQYLRGGPHLQSAVERRIYDLAPALSNVLSTLDPGDGLIDFLKTSRWHMCCLTTDGRAAMVNAAIEGAVEFNRQHPGSHADWQALAHLPVVDGGFYETVAKSLDDLAARLVAVGPADQQESGEPTSVRAHRESLFPNSLDGIDQDLIDLVLLLDTHRPTKSDAQICREFYGDSESGKARARKAPARIRKLRASKRTTLPPRTN